MFVTAISQANPTSNYTSQHNLLSRELLCDAVTIDRTFTMSKLKPIIQSLFISWKQLNRRQSTMVVSIELFNGMNQSKRMKITSTMDINIIFAKIQAQIARLSIDSSDVKLIQLEIEISKKRSQAKKVPENNQVQATLFQNLDQIRSKFGIDNLLGKSSLRELMENPLALAS